MSTSNPTSSVKVVPSLLVAAYDAADDGATVDTAGFRNCLVVLDAGEATVTPGEGEEDPDVPSTADVSLEASSDGTTWAALTGASFVQVTPDNDNASYVGQVNCDLNKRYLRAVVDVDGEVTLGVTFFLMGAESAPVAQIKTVAFTK